MPYKIIKFDAVANCTKGVIPQETIVYVTPAKFKPDEDELAKLTPKQLAAAAEEYPKEYDLELGYIGKGAKED